MVQLAIFVSGEGTNMENLIRHFRDNRHVEVSLVISNRADANALNRARRLGVEAIHIGKSGFSDGQVMKLLAAYKINCIVLAGFLLLVPEPIIRVFPGRIINLHPALLPRHGGKGMYGMKVHQSVVDSGDAKTGITIHYVNERFDEGKIIAQFETPVLPGESAEDVMKKVRALEQEHFAPEIEKALSKLPEYDA
jgi:phosphoribosylglycinamide formyltransferase-1